MSDETTKLANAIVGDHDNFQKTFSKVLAQAQVNYAFLCGDHNKIRNEQVLDDVYKASDLKARSQTNYSFDRIEAAMRQLAPSLMEAIPGVGIVPTSSSPVKSENADIAEKFVEFHREKVWNAKRFLSFDMLPNGYPGGACYVQMYPRRIGTIRVPYKDGEPYLFHKAGDVEAQVEVNTDGTLVCGGKDFTPEELGVTIRERPEVLMDLRVLTIFDVSVQGKISRSLRDTVSVTVRCVKSVGDLITMFPDSKSKILDVAEKIGDEQADPPMDGVDEYLGAAGFPKPRFGTLTGNQRLLEVYQRFINPCYDYPSGAIVTAISIGATTLDTSGRVCEIIDESKELPWKHHKTRSGLMPMVWFPFSMNKTNGPIPLSDIQKAEGAQRAWDRAGNAAMAGLAYQSQPPIFAQEGTLFSHDLTNWYDTVDYPLPGSFLFYRLPVGQNPQMPTVHPEFGGRIDPQMMQLMDGQLNNALNMSSGLREMPKTVSGESFQAQWTVDQRDLLPLQEAQQAAWFELYELLIGAATTEYYQGQKFIVPEKDKYSVLEFHQEIFGDDFDYIIVSKINKPVTKKARIDLINTVVDLFAKLGQIPPEQAEMIGLNKILEAMDLEEMGLLEQEVHPSLIKAKWELAQMTSGHDVPRPLNEDAHRIHMLTDLGEIQSVRFLSYDKEIQERLIFHYKEHAKNLKAFNLIEQQELQQKAMAQEVGRQQLQMQNQPTPGEPTQEPQPQPI